MKQYATIRLSNLGLVKQVKSKAALEGISLLDLVEKALYQYIMQAYDGSWEEVLKDMETIASKCGSCVDTNDHMRMEDIGMIARGYLYKRQPKK